MKNALVTVSIAGATSLLAWLIVLWKLDPFQSTGLGLGLFFLSLSVFLIAVFTMFGFLVRRYLNKGEISFLHFNVSLRQGLLLTLLTVLALVFLILGVLRIWNAILLLVMTVLLELYFESKAE